MIAAFDSMLGGTFFDASQASSDDFETSEQNSFGDECYLRSSRDPVGTRPQTPRPGNAKRHESKQNGLKVRQAKWTAYGVAASFRKFSVHRSPHKTVRDEFVY